MALPKNPDRPNKNMYAEGEDPLAREGGPASPPAHGGFTSDHIEPPFRPVKKPLGPSKKG